MSGFIAVHRKMLDNPVVMKDAEHLAIWMWLLLKASWKESDVLFNGERITLQAGDLPPISRRTIASDLHISESKVQRVLKRFETEHQIEQRTNRQCRLISIVSWDMYQSGEQPIEPQVNHERTTSEPRVNTIEEGNKGINNSHSIKKPYGAFGRVLLTDKEYTKLKSDYPDLYEDAIRIVDNYMEQKDKTYKSCAAAIRSWGIEASRKEKSKNDADDTRRGYSKRKRIPADVGQGERKHKKYADTEFPMAKEFFG